MTEIGDKEVCVAVVVVIGCHTTKTPISARHMSRVGNICKCAVPIIAIQVIGYRSWLLTAERLQC